MGWHSSPQCTELMPPMDDFSNSLLAAAQAGKRAVFFVDAAHFVFGAFLGYLWCFARCWIKAPSGRQRCNVLGALNAITYEVITVTTLTYINAESVCQLLRKLAA